MSVSPNLYDPPPPTIPPFFFSAERLVGRFLTVVSGIAVSFDGRRSHYLPLPPVLPRRPIDWHHYGHHCDYLPPAPFLVDNKAFQKLETRDDGRDSGRRSNVIDPPRPPAVAAALLARLPGATAFEKKEACFSGPGPRGYDATAAGGEERGGRGEFLTCWQALPRKAVEAITLFVSIQNYYVVYLPGVQLK